MDGLECSEILLSSLERTKRIDSEFYKKQSLNIAKLMKQIKAQSITNYVTVSDGNHMGISEKFVEKGIPYYRGQDIHNFFIENAHPICIDFDTYNIPYMHRSHLKKGDVLLSIVGTIGKSALVYSDREATCSCKLAILRPKNKQMSSILAVYLKTQYGYDQVEKFKRGAVQMGFLLEDMSQILIPDFTDAFITIIDRVLQSSFVCISKANDLYNSAETQLLNELQFNHSNVSDNGYIEKKLSDSFGLSGRLDAEYYQPKYDNIIKSLNTKETVESVCQIYDNNYEPEINTEYQYIEIADVGLHGEISLTEKIIGNELPTRARRKVKKGQVVISSIEGSLNSCALITEELDEALCSTGFYVIDSDKINSESLLVLFKSEPIQELLKQRCSGTILTAISKEEFKKMPLPFIDDVVQKEIAEKVQKSFAMRKKAYSLIKIAVKAVEIAIEQNEEVATKWLRENVELLEG